MILRTTDRQFLLRVTIGAPFYPLPATVKVVETVVLLVNDNDVPDLRELTAARVVVCFGRRVRRHRLRAARGCRDRQNNSENDRRR